MENRFLKQNRLVPATKDVRLLIRNDKNFQWNLKNLPDSQAINQEAT